jgi:hypothetical protein
VIQGARGAFEAEPDHLQTNTDMAEPDQEEATSTRQQGENKAPTGPSLVQRIRGELKPELAGCGRWPRPRGKFPVSDGISLPVTAEKQWS